MPVKVGEKGKLQSYDPSTGKFGSGNKDQPTEVMETKKAVVSVEYNGQTIQIVGPLEHVQPQRSIAEPMPKDNSVGFKEAVKKYGASAKDEQ